MADKRKNTRSQKGYLSPDSLEHRNLFYYKRALESSSIEMEEYWYQSVFHGGIENNSPSFYCEHRKRSYADLVTNDIFEKSRKTFHNEDVDDLSSNEHNPNDTYLTADRSSNPSLFKIYSTEQYVELTRFIIEICEHLTSDERKVFAFFLRKSGVHTMLVDIEDATVLELITLIREQEELNQFPKEAVIAQFSSRHSCEVAINKFTEKFRKYIHILKGI